MDSVAGLQSFHKKDVILSCFLQFQVSPATLHSSQLLNSQWDLIKNVSKAIVAVKLEIFRSENWKILLIFNVPHCGRAGFRPLLLFCQLAVSSSKEAYQSALADFRTRSHRHQLHKGQCSPHLLDKASMEAVTLKVVLGIRANRWNLCYHVSTAYASARDHLRTGLHFHWVWADPRLETKAEGPFSKLYFLCFLCCEHILLSKQ